MHPVAEFRRGIMRLPFAAITSWSPLSKVYYQSAHPENLKYRAGYQRGLVCLMCVGGGDSKALVGNPPSDGVTIKHPKEGKPRSNHPRNFFYHDASNEF